MLICCLQYVVEYRPVCFVEVELLLLVGFYFWSFEDGGDGGQVVAVLAVFDGVPTTLGRQVLAGDGEIKV